MLLLLAQLVAPPLQPGPARVPDPAPNERPLQSTQDNSTDDEGLIINPGALPQGQEELAHPEEISGSPNAPVLKINGDTPYSQTELNQILRSCRRSANANDQLKRCAESLSGRLQKDGYVNSRVYIDREPAPGQLTVVMGRLVELHINTDDQRLEHTVRRRLSHLIGQTLHLPSLQRQLRQLKQRSVVSSVSGSLGKLGSDPTKAMLTLTVIPASHPWRGDLSLRNDGNAGSGEWRALAVLQKPELIAEGDLLQIYGELNADGDPELGVSIGSLSYTIPLGESVSLTGSFGASRRNLVEARQPAHGLSFRQYQGLAQLQWTFADSGDQTWYALAGLSANRNDSYHDGQSFPLIIGGGPDGDLSTGYLRIGLGHAGRNANLRWSGQIYGLQGIAGLSSSEELHDLSFYGVAPGESRALGGIASVGWQIDPSLQLNVRAAGQVAFNELTSDMGFALGSDVGLKGLPGTLISGDNGWLSTGELNWTFWHQKDNALQLVPFIGIGGIQTSRSDVSIEDTIGTGGILLRWLHGQHWSVELGWVDQFHADNNAGFWNDWLLGNGAYGKIRYRF